VSERWKSDVERLREAAPQHILFLCVANSARSQMAEGIARSLAPPDVEISSAGSEPTPVRSQAVTVLAELGIDASAQRSKGVDDIERTVDAVVTLCEEEVCPVWLGDAVRVHWGLPDPAAVKGTEAEKLDAFRRVRDELAGRLRVLFAAQAP
jgi:protein-tyrosine-phosphatase